MEFKAGEVNDVADWFSKRIGIAAVTPDMAGLGFRFLDGRPYTLKDKDAAYLYYEKDGNRRQPAKRSSPRTGLDASVRSTP